MTSGQYRVGRTSELWRKFGSEETFCDVQRCSVKEIQRHNSSVLKSFMTRGENLASVIGICQNQVLRLAIQNYEMSRISRALLSCWSNQQYAYRALIWLPMYVLHFLRTTVLALKYTLSFASKVWICWVLFKFLLFKLSQQTSEFLFHFPKLLRIWLSSIQTIQTHVQEITWQG